MREHRPLRAPTREAYTPSPGKREVAGSNPAGSMPWARSSVVERLKVNTAFWTCAGRRFSQSFPVRAPLARPDRLSLQTGHLGSKPTVGSNPTASSNTRRRLSAKAGIEAFRTCAGAAPVPDRTGESRTFPLRAPIGEAYIRRVQLPLSSPKTEDNAPWGALLHRLFGLARSGDFKLRQTRFCLAP